VILGGGVAVCLLLSAHRAVIFAIAQLSCVDSRRCFLGSLESARVTPEAFASYETRGRRSSRLVLTAPFPATSPSTSTKSVSCLAFPCLWSIFSDSIF